MRMREIKDILDRRGIVLAQDLLADRPDKKTIRRTRSTLQNLLPNVSSLPDEFIERGAAPKLHGKPPRGLIAFLENTPQEGKGVFFHVSTSVAAHLRTERTLDREAVLNYIKQFAHTYPPAPQIARATDFIDGIDGMVGNGAYIDEYVRDLGRGRFRLSPSESLFDEYVSNCWARLNDDLPGFYALGGCRLTSWIFGVAHSAYCNLLRRKRTIDNTESEYVKRASFARNNAEVELIEDRISLDFLLVRAHLDEQSQRILVRHFQGCTDSEIAEECGIKPGSVRSRLSRIREALRGGLANPKEKALEV